MLFNLQMKGGIPLELFRIFGTLALNGAPQTQNDIDKTSEKAGKFSENLKKGIKTVAKWGAAIGAAAATGVTAMTKAAIDSYADYEQLVGGVETLFKNSANTVIANASKAYTTAGMSANEYMETVTGFSASLLQSLGNDTVAAAQKADMAITDMSDNANKMGTSMESIQNAYSGFAKQNYTMLDNLKLGYGGTKEEMERLLADAQAISGIEYDISSYADVVDAIHVIQTEMGITGTTAKEASTTISGSLTSMKSAWQNLLTGIADGKQDMGVLVTQFFDSVVTVADNLVPRISQALETLPQLITVLVPRLISKVSGLFETLLPVVVNGATSLLNSVVKVLPQLVTTITNALPGLISGIEQVFYSIVDALPQLMTVICEALPKLIPQLVTAITNMVVYLAKNISAIIQPLIDNLPDIIISIVDALMDNLPTLIEGVVALVIGIVRAIPQIIVSLIKALPTIIKSIVKGLWKAFPQLLEGIISIVGEIGTAIWDILSGFFTTLGGWFSNLWESIKNIFAPVIEWFGNLFSTIWESIVTVFSTVGTWVYDNIIAPVASFFTELWNKIVSAYHTVIDPWIEIVKRISKIIYDNVIVPIKNFFVKLWKDIVGVFSVAANWFTTNIANPIKNIFAGIWDNLKNGASTAWNSIKNVFGHVSDWFKNVFSKAWQAVKNVFSTGGKVFAGIKDGIVSAFKTVVNAIIKGINKVITVPFKGINTALKKIKGIEIVGVKPFDWLDTIDTPQIPELATGTVVTRATQAVIGEDGAEAVVPLEKHTEWIDKVADKVVSKMDTNGGNSALIAKLDEVIESIKSLKIYLNTGALVGGISGEMNEALGNIAFAAERGR